jgi:hypothetical protein
MKMSAIPNLQKFNTMKRDNKSITLDYVEKEILKMVTKKSKQEEKIKVALNRIFMDRVLYSKYNCSLSHVLLKVWTYIVGHEHEDEMKKRLLEELQEMESMLHEEGDGMDTSMQDGQGGSGMRFKVDPMEDYMNEKDLTEAEIEEMLAEMGGEEPIEESSLINSQTQMNRGNRGGGSVQGRPERRSGMNEEEIEEVETLREQLKKLKQENKSLNEGFTNRIETSGAIRQN